MPVCANGRFRLRSYVYRYATYYDATCCGSWCAHLFIGTGSSVLFASPTPSVLSCCFFVNSHFLFFQDDGRSLHARTADNELVLPQRQEEL